MYKQNVPSSTVSRLKALTNCKQALIEVKCKKDQTSDLRKSIKGFREVQFRDRKTRGTKSPKSDHKKWVYI